MTTVAPTISEQEALMDRLTWDEEDLVLRIRLSLGGPWSFKTRAWMASLSNPNHVVITDSVHCEILMPFTLADGSYYHPEVKS
jgi:hypothetical protein